MTSYSYIEGKIPEGKIPNREISSMQNSYRQISFLGDTGRFLTFRIPAGKIPFFSAGKIPVCKISCGLIFRG